MAKLTAPNNLSAEQQAEWLKSREQVLGKPGEIDERPADAPIAWQGDLAAEALLGEAIPEAGQPHAPADHLGTEPAPDASLPTPEATARLDLPASTPGSVGAIEPEGSGADSAHGFVPSAPAASTAATGVGGSSASGSLFSRLSGAITGLFGGASSAHRGASAATGSSAGEMQPATPGSAARSAPSEPGQGVPDSQSGVTEAVVKGPAAGTATGQGEIPGAGSLTTGGPDGTKPDTRPQQVPQPSATGTGTATPGMVPPLDPAQLHTPNLVLPAASRPHYYPSPPRRRDGRMRHRQRSR